MASIMRRPFHLLCDSRQFEHFWHMLFKIMMIHQIDVVTAFLNGRLDEKIYMFQPDGYIAPGEQHLVCKLNNSTYGLKQSLRCWNRVFCEYLESIGFAQSDADPCVYIRAVDPMAITAVCVDDLPLIMKTEEEMRMTWQLGSR